MEPDYNRLAVYAALIHLIEPHRGDVSSEAMACFSGLIFGSPTFLKLYKQGKLMMVPTFGEGAILDQAVHFTPNRTTSTFRFDGRPEEEADIHRQLFEMLDNIICPKDLIGTEASWAEAGVEVSLSWPTAAERFSLVVTYPGDGLYPIVVTKPRRRRKKQ